MLDVEDIHPDSNMNSPKRVGLLLFVLVFGVFGIWSALAPIDGAAQAAGRVTVSSNRQVIQHLEGGIVQSISARDGDFLNAGEELLRLDTTQSEAELSVAESQQIALTAREARLRAEMLGAEFSPLEQLESGDPIALEEYAAQLQLFNSRNTARLGSIEVLEQQIQQLHSRLQGLHALLVSKRELSDSFAEELQDVEDLLRQGFADRNRLREIQRNVARLGGEIAELEANIAATEVQIGETRLEIMQIDREFQNEVANSLAETQTALTDLNERITALRDVVTRSVVRTPVSGIVNGLQVHTISAVIPPGSTIADVVPQSDELIIDAQVAPIDIDRVEEGQEATIRFPSFSYSTVPSIEGQLTTLSADSLVDQVTGLSFYQARVSVSPESLSQLEGLILVPGMPAEVYIATGSRTLLQYLFKPISNALARSFRED